jgi:hypothetical protein
MNNNIITFLKFYLREFRAKHSAKVYSASVREESKKGEKISVA